MGNAQLWLGILVVASGVMNLCLILENRKLKKELSERNDSE